MIELLRTGKVDFVAETAFSAILYEELAGAEILLRQWKGGQASYRAFFFTRIDSSIQRIEDLAGKLIAFEDPGSTSGYLVPKATIIDHGLAPRFTGEVRRSTDVGYLFADSELNVVAWVARGRVDAGVLSDGDWADPSRVPLGLKRQLRVFHKTAKIVRSLLVARPGLAESRKRGVVDSLLGMHDTEEGRDVLQDFFKTERFDRLTGDAEASIEHIRSLIRRHDKPQPRL